MVDEEIQTADWLQLIRAEYLESPGLSLTGRQAERLWGLSPAACASLLEAMVDAHFLRRTEHGQYVRVNPGC